MIKWEGYPHSQNTWEDVENTNCPTLISEFEKKEKQKRKTNRTPTKGKEKKRKQQKSDSEEEDSGKKSQEDDQPGGYEHGDQPQEILGAKRFNGELYFFCSWFVIVLDLIIQAKQRIKIKLFRIQRCSVQEGPIIGAFILRVTISGTKLQVFVLTFKFEHAEEGSPEKKTTSASNSPSKAISRGMNITPLSLEVDEEKNAVSELGSSDDK